MAGASSGVAVEDDCVSVFMDLKKKRKYRWIVYKIDGERKVVLEETGAPDVSVWIVLMGAACGVRGNRFLFSGAIFRSKQGGRRARLLVCLSATETVAGLCKSK
eukprot:6254393-Pyramimonas_sp.AAC.1